MRAGAMALLGLLCVATPALAQHRCRVPLGDWQPREALQSRLEQQGWTVLSIRADDGCYKVRARNEAGERLEGKFDPATLEPVARRGGHGDPRDHDDGTDPD
ncbi:MAG: PepSY domain-containing protein [Alsobacter sp.]